MTGDPVIDARTAEDIISQALALGGVYTPEWIPAEGDRGLALVAIFARLLEITITRLNRVPENCFLAFLDAAGVHLLPPSAARAPVRFIATVGATDDGVVPAGTPLATAPPPGQAPLTFETEKKLIVSRSALVHLFAHDPGADGYTDLQAVVQANEKNASAPFQPFAGLDLMPHRLYLSQDRLFEIGHPATIKLIVRLEQITPEYVDLFQKGLQWTIQTDANEVLEITPPPGSVTADLAASTVTVILDNPALASLARTSLGGALGYWLQVQTTQPLTPAKAALQIEAIQVLASAADIRPELAYANTVPVDLGLACHPFGERPKLLETFFLAIPEALSKAGSAVTLTLDYVAGVAGAGGVQLNYEFWDGSAWEVLGVVKNTGLGATAHNFTDETNAFTATPSTGKKITFDCPPMAPVAVHGKKNYWLRVRLSQGNYGEEAKLRMKTSPAPANPTLADYEYREASFQPPIITSLSASYDYVHPKIPTGVCTENNFDLTVVDSAVAFKPFAVATEDRPACYLGFDSPFTTQAVSLYLEVAEAASAGPLQVVWEYWNGARWVNLGVQDGTRNLAASGLVEFLGPRDVAMKSLFGVESYWLRLVLEAGDKAALGLNGVYPNTTWAKNCITVTDELLGASVEAPGATFNLSQYPVLPGVQIVVREPERPSAVELEVLLAEEGADAVESLVGAPATGRECWVRWHQVNHFRFSGEKSRHYVLDWSSGRLTFGDGVRGMIPPAGRDNIRARWYQAGGGRRGNVRRNTITVLKRAMPFVDRAFNVDRAGGGGEGESVAQVKIRGPQAIKNQDRAVTWEDYEWLAREASFQVARARCLPAHTQQEAGIVRLIVVPWSDDPQPQPSEGLKAAVAEYIASRRRRLATATLKIMNPRYVAVSVSAKVIPRRLEEADLVRRQVKLNLTAYFHPLTGGPENQGWEFGRDVFVSEVSKVIEDTAGVDHADEVTIVRNAYLIADSLIASGEHDITIMV